jgi:hypothetical protein
LPDGFSVEITVGKVNIADVVVRKNNLDLLKPTVLNE